jgi:hypothetical protein
MAGDNPPPVERGRRFWTVAALTAAFIAGAVLRGWNLPAQVLGGDELHGVRAAVALEPLAVLTGYSLRDYCLPLTALFSWLLGQGVPLSELELRLPSLLAGVAAVVVLPALLARRLGTATMLLYALLLAVSPALVVYSRMARSYMPLALVAPLAVAAFASWWERGGWGRGSLAVLLAALAMWLHLGAGPLLAGLVAFAVVDAGVSALRAAEDGRRRLARAVGFALALSVACGLFLLPAWPSLLRVLRVKRRALAISPTTVWEAMRLLAGTATPGLAIAFWLLAVAGLVLLLRRQRRQGVLIATVLASQAVGLVVMSPQGSNVPLVLARYLLVLLPFVLLLAAVALAAPWRAGRHGGWWAARAVSLAVPLALFALGPLPRRLERMSSFDQHNLYVDFPRTPPPLAGDRLPPIYRRLPPGAVVEVPWSTVWNQGHAVPRYQEVHRHAVLVAGGADLPRHPRLRWRNEVRAEPESLLASRASAVVVHLRLPSEEDAMPAATADREARRELRRRADRVAERLQAAWGPADWSAGTLRGWDLRRLRRAHAAAGE